MRIAAFILILLTLTLPVWPDDLARFTSEVETLRGHRFLRPVEHKVLARAELKDFLARQMEAELPTSVDTYMATLRALGLVDDSASVGSMLELYDAQVLAFYDTVGHIYYSLDEPPPDVVLPPVMVDAVIVHEIEHALQDQLFDAGRRSVEMQSNWDAAIAYQSLLEGEALLVMIGHLAANMDLTLDDVVKQEAMIDAIREAAAAGTNVPDDVAPYFVESLKFPYVDGLAFVVDLYRDGGWDAIDAALRNPPRSTEELIHPAIYRDRVASGTKAAEPQGSEPADRLVETVLGEFHWTFLLGREAGEGWASDLVSVWHGEKGPTVLVDSTWDTEQDAAEFEGAFDKLLEERDVPNLTHSRNGIRVKVGWGIDSRTARLFTGEAGETLAAGE